MCSCFCCEIKKIQILLQELTFLAFFFSFCCGIIFVLSFYNAICVELIYWLKSTTMVLHLKNSANTLGKNVMVLRIKICAILNV